MRQKLAVHSARMPLSDRRRRSQALPPRPHTYRDANEYKPPPMILTAQVLMNELRQKLHAIFHTVDPELKSASPHDNLTQQAFRFFTTTNWITPEAFHHRIIRLGLRTTRSVCAELFGRIDQEDLGEIDYATFAHRVFLPASYFRELARQTPRETVPTPTESATLPGHQPARSLKDICRSIGQKLEMKGTRGNDRLRRSFRFFTKTNGIDFDAFSRGMAALEMNLSPSTCEQLFHHCDQDHNGVIDLAEFMRTILEYEPDKAIRRPGAGHGNITSNQSIRSYASHESNEPVVRSLTMAQITERLRTRLSQPTPEGVDFFRQAYKLFGKQSGITQDELRKAVSTVGLTLSSDQLSGLFELCDFDKSGDLHLNEFVQGVMLDDSSMEAWPTEKDRARKADELARNKYMAALSVQRTWTMDDIERMVREKIEQRTSKSTDCFRQALRIFKKVNNISPADFRTALEGIGIELDTAQAEELFQRFDSDGSGGIDLTEFIHRVLPPDYVGATWVAAADEMHAMVEHQKKLDLLQNPDKFMTDIEMENWTLDDIERRLRDKIQQSTSKSSDVFRQAYKIFKKTNHITMDNLRDRLLALGFRLTPAQCTGLFKRYDMDNSGEIDLQEFCSRILPPDYTGDGDVWSHSDRLKKRREQKILDLVHGTKNGLIPASEVKENDPIAVSGSVAEAITKVSVSHPPSVRPSSARPSTSRLVDTADNTKMQCPSTPSSKARHCAITSPRLNRLSTSRSAGQLEDRVSEDSYDDASEASEYTDNTLTGKLYTAFLQERKKLRRQQSIGDLKTGVSRASARSSKSSDTMSVTSGMSTFSNSSNARSVRSAKHTPRFNSARIAHRCVEAARKQEAEINNERGRNNSTQTS